MIGSGRRPLSNGIHAVNRTMPAAQFAGLARRHRGPQSRQHLTREQQPAHYSGDQVRQPHPQAGVGDMGHQRQQVVVPAERVLGAAEPAEVVGHVAGAVGDPGHAQDVAVVRRVRPDHMPQHEAGDHRDVGQGERAPVRRNRAGASGVRPTGRGATARSARRWWTRSPAPSRPVSASSAWWRTGCRWSPTASNPRGAGPLRSVNTPTICGRRFGSGKPPPSGLPAGSFSPTKVAKAPAFVEVISMR